MIWLDRFLLLVGILVVALLAWIYGKLGGGVALGVTIFAVIGVTACACLFAETRYNKGFVAGMNWLKNLWEDKDV